MAHVTGVEHACVRLQGSSRGVDTFGLGWGSKGLTVRDEKAGDLPWGCLWARRRPKLKGHTASTWGFSLPFTRSIPPSRPFRKEGRAPIYNRRARSLIPSPLALAQK